jgi:hypothetical protein
MLVNVERTCCSAGCIVVAIEQNSVVATHVMYVIPRTPFTRSSRTTSLVVLACHATGTTSIERNFERCGVAERQVQVVGK